MDRVCGDVGASVTEDDVDDDEVVNVLHVLSNREFTQSFLDGTVNEYVAGRAISHLARNMVVENVLSVCPFDFNLRLI